MTSKDKIKLAIAIVVLLAAGVFIWMYLKDSSTPAKPAGPAPAAGTSTPDQPPQAPPSGGRGRVKPG